MFMPEKHLGMLNWGEICFEISEGGTKMVILLR